jgi:Glycine zipper
MYLPEIFHAVKMGSIEEKREFWSLCKIAASTDTGGMAVGLTKIAFDVWADSYERGLNPVAERDTREAFAGSFGSAWAVEGLITKAAEYGNISSDEYDLLLSYVAESAVEDLGNITKSAGFVSFMKSPQVIGALSGAALGAGIGAWADDKNRQRGALAGLIPGALIGALGGHEISTHQADQMKAMIEKNKAAPVMDMSGWAQKGKGRAKKSALHLKLADIMQGVEQGGQPPMNAADGQDQPGALEGGQEGGPASTDPNAQGGEAIGQGSEIADGALDGKDKAQKTIDNMIFLAQQVQLPQLAQELDQKRDQLAEHFAEGHAYLPPELQHHFAQSEHAEAFMKKYKQRFGTVASGTKKTASAPLDWSSWHLHH